MSTVVDELITILGFKLDPGAEAEGSKLTTITQNITKGAAVAAAAIVTFTGTMVELVSKFSDATVENSRFADSIGVTVSELKQWEFAAKRVGGSSSDLRSDLLKLSQSMSSPIPGEFNQTLFMLGIATRDAAGNIRTPIQALEDLSKKFNSFSAIKSQEWGQKAGLNQTMIRLLQQGSKGLEELKSKAKDLGALIPEDVTGSAKRFHDAMEDVHTVMATISKIIASNLTPLFADLTEKFSKWLVANKEFIASNLTQVIKGVTEGVRDFVNIVKGAVSTLNDWLEPLKGSVSGLDKIKIIAPLVTGVLLALTAAMGVKFVEGIILSTVKLATFIATTLGIVPAAAVAETAEATLAVTMQALSVAIGEVTVALTAMNIASGASVAAAAEAAAAEAVLGTTAAATGATMLESILAATAAMGAFVVELLVAAAPFIAIGAAIGVVVLAVDDFITYLQGGDSVIGHFFDSFQKNFPALYDAFKLLTLPVTILFDALETGIGWVLDNTGKWAKSLSGLTDQFSAWLSILDPIWSFIGKIFDKIPSIGGLFKGAEDFAESLGLGDGVADKVKTAIEGTLKIVPQAPSANIPANASVPVSASIVNSTSRTNVGGNNVSIQVNGAGDPASVGADVAGRVSQTLGTTAQTLTPGIRAPLVS